MATRSKRTTATRSACMRTGPTGWTKGIGANLDAPANRETQAIPPGPSGTFLFLFQLLKYFEGESRLVGTVIIPNGVIVALMLLPLLGYGRMRKFAHFVGIFVMVVLLGGARAHLPGHG